MRPTHRFAALTAAPLEVTFDAPPWRQTRRVDLSDGLDAELVLDVPAFAVSGRVTKGDRGHAATVTFAVSRDEDYRHRVATDEEGRYETLLFGQPYLALVHLAGRRGQPVLFPLAEPPLDPVTTLDFPVPGNDYVVRVVSEAGGGPAPALR